jgi:hypothetical protein
MRESSVAICISVAVLLLCCCVMAYARMCFATWNARRRGEMTLLLYGGGARATTTTRKRRYLLVGSAPYVPEWWNRNASVVESMGYRVCPLNNAWQIVGPERTWCWMISGDFAQNQKSAKRFPTDAEMKRMKYIHITTENSTSTDGGRAREDCTLRVTGPPTTHASMDSEVTLYTLYGSYDGRTTTAFDALFRIMMLEGGDASSVEIATVGMDMDFSGGGSNNFYGGTARDPFKYGDAYPARVYRRVKLVGEYLGFSLVDYGSSPGSLNPFAKKQLR